MELFVSKYFFLHLYTIPSFLLKITGFFTVFNNILNILNLFIDLLSLLRNAKKKNTRLAGIFGGVEKSTLFH